MSPTDSASPIPPSAGRMLVLQRALNDTMTPRLRQIIWFPVSKIPRGETFYGHKEVHERNLPAGTVQLRL